MLILRDPDSVSGIADPAVRDLAGRWFAEGAAEDDYDPDVHGYLIVVEPGDSPEALEAESGRPILSCYAGGARFGEPGFRPVFECLEEHPGCYLMVFVPGRGDFGVVVLVPKEDGIDPDLLALCAEYAEPAP